MKFRIPDRHYPTAVVLATLLLIFFAQGAFFVLNVQLKPIVLEMGWPREVPSLAFAAAFFGGGVGALYFGQLSERIGMARVAMIGSAMVPIGVLLTSLAREGWHVWAAYAVFVGLLGNACMFTPLIANVSRWFTDACLSRPKSAWPPVGDYTSSHGPPSGAFPESTWDVVCSSKYGHDIRQCCFSGVDPEWS